MKRAEKPKTAAAALRSWKSGQTRREGKIKVSLAAVTATTKKGKPHGN